MAYVAPLPEGSRFCGHCDGTGEVNEDFDISCKWCHGTGFLAEEQPMPYCGPIPKDRKQCPKCLGHGTWIQVYTKEAFICDLCDGKGLISISYHVFNPDKLPLPDRLKYLEDEE